MHVHVFPQALWRFSRRPRNELELTRLGHTASWLDETRTLIARNASLASDLDSILDRPAGYHERLAKSTTTSDVRRRLRYARELILSMYLGHHTGRKGGVSAARVSPQPFGAPEVQTSPNPEWAALLDIAILPFERQSKPSTTSSAKYEIAVDRSTKLGMPMPKISNVKAMFEAIATHLNEHTTWSEPAVISAAVDLMFDASGIPSVIEVHVPARSIGSAGIAHQLAFGTEPSTWLHDFPSIPAAPTLINDLSHLAFHQLDYAFLVAMLNRTESHITPYTICVDIALRGETVLLGNNSLALSDVRRDTLQRIAAQSLGGAPFDGFVCSLHSERGLAHALERIDDWVVLKDNRNLPWWHPDAHRVIFVSGPDDPSLSAARSRLAHTEVLAEPLIAPSQDTSGRSGELRIFAFLVRD
jgi:hypothetical protein